MWWLIIPVSFFLIILYLLFAPFFIEIDSNDGLCGIRFHRIASANLMFKEKMLFLDLRITGWHTKINLFEKINRGKKDKPTPVKISHRTISFQRILSLIKSFKVKKAFMTMDTGDMQLNGILFPVLTMISIKSGNNISINFLDENTFILQIKNNIARILWALIKPIN